MQLVELGELRSENGNDTKVVRLEIARCFLLGGLLHPLERVAHLNDGRLYARIKALHIRAAHIIIKGVRAQIKYARAQGVKVPRARIKKRSAALCDARRLHIGLVSDRAIRTKETHLLPGIGLKNSSLCDGLDNVLCRAFAANILDGGAELAEQIHGRHRHRQGC